MFDHNTMKLNVDKYILMALQEDITSEDVSTNSVIKEHCLGEVELIAKEDGVICGLQVFERVFLLLDDQCKVSLHVKDGDEVKKGDHLGKVVGDIRTLLSGERVALNYLQRMSGIATYTRSMVKLLEGTSISLLDTRKTTPNNRIFEKYAVKVDEELHNEVLERYRRLNLAPYKGFLNPVLRPVTDEKGDIVDIAVDYTEGYSDQMLRYSKEYATLI